MSGPKIDSAELERRRKEALERARQERLQRISEAIELYRKAQKECVSAVNEIRAAGQQFINRIRGREEMSPTVGRLDTLKKDFSERVAALSGGELPTEPEEISGLAEKIKEGSERILAGFREQVAPELERISSYCSDMDRLGKMHEFTGSLSQNPDISAFNFTDYDFGNMSVDCVKDAADETYIDARSAIAEIAELANDDSITINDKKELFEFARNIMLSSGSSRESLRSALDEYNIGRVGIVQRLEEFEDLYQQYVTEYIVYMEAINRCRSKKIAVKPRAKQSFCSEDALREEVERIRAASVEENEQSYIRQQLDEVMAMFGYDLCSDIVLSESQTGHHYLSRSKKEDTAIHIHVSNKKQVMMEIVGTDKGPGNKQGRVNACSAEYTELSVQDTQRLLYEQGQFCQLHPQISDELRKRGVILKTKVHRQPDVKYCKRIISLGSEEEKSQDGSNKYSVHKKTGKRKAASEMRWKK